MLYAIHEHWDRLKETQKTEQSGVGRSETVPPRSVGEGGREKRNRTSCQIDHSAADSGDIHILNQKDEKHM